MKQHLLFFFLLCMACIRVRADYTDIPYTISSSGTFSVTDEDETYTFSTKTGYYQEWDHYVIFWSTGYGSKTGTVTTIGSGNYLLNLSEMKTYAERCYDAYTSVGFLDPTSSEGGGHKIIILAYYSTAWHATGSGVKSGSKIYGVLNIAHSSANPSATNPYYTFSHEIAHAYQYLGYAKNGGNAGFNYESGMYGWVSYYEACGNWQAALVYNDLYFPQCYNLYNKTQNLTFTHSWHCYQCYPLNDYLTEKCGQTVIGDIWVGNTGVDYAEPLEKYMSIYDKTAEELYRDLFFFSMRATTWDLDRWQTYLTAEGTTQDTYINHNAGTKAGKSATTTPYTYSDSYFPTQSTYQYVTTNSSSAIHQVAYSSAPQSGGFNVIPLNVPSSSTNRTITTTFTALAPGASLASGDNKEYWTGSMWAKNSSQTAYNTGTTAQSNTTYNTYKNWRGFRLGYVGYNKTTKQRYYSYIDKVYCTGTDETSVSLSFDVPTDVDSVYFVVSPALTNYLRNESSGSYDISSNSDYVSFQQSFDQWPYRVQFYNTNIKGLSNPSTTFSGTAETTTTYTTEQLTDLTQDTSEKTYTIRLADGSPSGAGFSVTSDLTSVGNNRYTTTLNLTSNNYTKYITVLAVDGYRYTVTVEDTDILIAYTERPVQFTLERNLYFPTTSDYSGTTYTLTATDLSAICDYLGCTSTALKTSSNWETADSFTDAVPSSEKFFLYAVDPTTEDLDATTTANGYGYWMDSNGDVVSYGDNSTYFMEYDETTGVFTFGQYPDALSTGDNNTLRFALSYTDASGDTRTVYLTFHCTIATSTSTTYAYSIQVDAEAPEGAGFTTTLTKNSTFDNYESTSELTASDVSDYVTPTAISGYAAQVNIQGNVITISYTQSDETGTDTGDPSEEQTGTLVEETITTFTPTRTTTLSYDISVGIAGQVSQDIDYTSTGSGTLYYGLGNKNANSLTWKGYAQAISSSQNNNGLYYYAANAVDVSELMAQEPVTESGLYTYYYNKEGKVLVDSEGAAFVLSLDNSAWTYTLQAAESVMPGAYTLYTAMRYFNYARSGRNYTTSNYLVFFQFNVVVHPMGDLNGDDALSLSDLTHLIDVLCGKETDSHHTGDVDRSGSVDIEDVSVLRQILMTK